MIYTMIGIVADKLVPSNMPGGWAGAMIAGFVGVWIGHGLFGTWGPVLAGFSVISALIGAIIVVIIVGFLADLF